MSRQKTISRDVVVDASIARAAGETQHPTSRACRDALDAMLKVCHKLVLSPHLKAEWDKHRSLYAEKWRGTMVARKKHVRVEPTPCQGLDDFCADDRTPAHVVERIRKDEHLVEATLASDRIVLSLDDEVRGHLGEALAAGVEDLASIHWSTLSWIRT